MVWLRISISNQTSKARYLISHADLLYYLELATPYVLRAIKIAAAIARMAPMIETLPFSRAGMNFFSPYHRRNATVSQSAIIE
jgi:hypothetical protein